jgi:hypothetical protein
MRDLDRKERFVDKACKDRFFETTKIYYRLQCAIMNPHFFTDFRALIVILLLLIVLGMGTVARGAPLCEAQSTAQTAALVELYTSEGCSSCPPADRRLSELTIAQSSGGLAVPIAMHVDYWDGLGWKDRFAKPEFAIRQSWLVSLAHDRTVYTPHFFVAGQALLHWSGELAQQIALINQRSAQASIKLNAHFEAVDRLVLEASSQTGLDIPLQLYLAVTEDDLRSQVKAGENGGATLHHDHVVREWRGPFPFAARKVATKTEVVLRPDWRREKLSLVAFVQDPETGRVVQAMAINGCLHGDVY